MSEATGAQLQQVLPANIQAERMVLGCVMLDNTVLAEVAAEIEPRDFTLPSYRQIFEAYLALAEREQEINPVSVAAELERVGLLSRVGGEFPHSFIASLFDGVPRFSTVKSYTRQLREQTLLRELIYAAQAIQADAFDGEVLPEDQLGRARYLLDKIEQRRPIAELRTGAMASADYIHKLERLQDSPRPFLGLATDVYDLDVTLGGLQRGDLIIEGARPSMGKTAAAARKIAGVARSRWNEKPVQVVFSLEMPPSEFMSRLLYGLAHVDSSRARNKCLTNEDWRAIHAAREEVSSWNLLIFGQDEAADVRQQGALLRRVRNEYGRVDAIYCDHLGFCKLGGLRTDNRNVIWDEVTKEQKRLAKQFDAPFVVLSQLSRANTMRSDKRPSLSDLRESGGIEQNADVVMFVHREHYYDPNADPGIAEWIIAKQRNGPLATVELFWQSNTAWFDNLHAR